MAKQWLNSMYFHGSNFYDPATRKQIAEKNDALIFTVKDTETLMTELKIIPKPTIDFFIAKEPQPFHRFNIPMDEVRKVTVPFKNRDREIAECLGKLQDFYASAKNGSRMEYQRQILKNPNLYSADVNIEDFYKTKTLMANANADGDQAVAGRYNMCFSDTEVDISRFEEDFPDPNVAPCPICLITVFYAETKEAISYILYDERVKDDQIDVVQRPNEFIKEYLDPIITDEGFTFDFKLFQKEEDLIITYFSDMHVRKPDFCAWWNMSFDMPTILNRLKRLGYNPQQTAQIMCHPDVPDQYKYVKYIPDPNRKALEEEDDGEEEEEEERSKNSKNKPHPSRLVDWVEIPGYTQHYCQMAMYSCLRKRVLLPSYKLDVIGQADIGIGKYDLKSNGYNIKDCNVKNFKVFLGYNIRDSFVQYMLEKKLQDMNQFVISASNTRLAKGNQMSIVIKNEIMLYLLNKGEIMGNAIDYGIFESFEGALVGRPELLEQFGPRIGGGVGEKSMVYSDCIDLDASSLYPSIIITHNVFKSALFGRVVDIYNGVTGASMGNGEGLFSDIETIDQSLFDICKQYLGLPSPEEIMSDIEEFCSRSMQ